MAEPTPSAPTPGTGASPARPRRRHAARLRLLISTERLNTPRAMAIFWISARLLVFTLWFVIFPSAQGDVVYYFGKIDNLFDLGPVQTLQEYPTPVIIFLALPWFLGLGTLWGYLIAFVAMMVALDLAFTVTLWRTGGRMRSQAVVFWTLFLVLVGPTGYLRFDLVTSVVAGWAIIAVLKQRPFLAGALAGLGAALKLWPALLWPALCGGPNRQKAQVSLGFFGMGGLLALASLAWAGWDRLLSPLSWQSDRGLQVESVWATIPMLLRGLGLGDYAVAVSRYQAFEIWGTGVRLWMSASDLAFVLGLAAAACAYLAWMVRGEGRLMESCALMLLVILVMIVTNKTFSPQYVIWLGGPVGAAFAVMGNRFPHSSSYRLDSTRLKRMATQLLGITALTTLVYPIGYAPLVRDLTAPLSWFRLPVTLVLVARNVLIVWLLISVLAWVWHFLRPAAFRSVRAHVQRIREQNAALLAATLAETS